MANTEEILSDARELGKKIATHAAAAKLEEAIRKLQADVEAQRALNDFNRHMAKLSEKEAAGQPIEVADKQQLEKLQGAVIRNPLLRDLQIAQMDYSDLMRKVDEAMAGTHEANEAPPGAPVFSPGTGGKLS